MNKHIENLFKKLEQWNGESVKYLLPLVNDIEHELLDIDDSVCDLEEYNTRIKDICGAAALSAGVVNFPDDLSNAYDFLVTDKTGAYLFREAGHRTWHIDQSEI